MRWKPLDENCLGAIAERLDVRASAETELAAQGLVSATRKTEVLIRYDGSDTSLPVPFDTIQTMRGAFETAHQQQFGFVYDNRDMIVEALTLECVTAESESGTSANGDRQSQPSEAKPIDDRLFINGSWRDAHAGHVARLKPTGPLSARPLLMKRMPRLLCHRIGNLFAVRATTSY